MKKNPYNKFPANHYTKKKDNPEHRIQAEYFKILALNEAEFPYLKFIHAIPNGGQRNIIVAAKMKREGTKRGVPDINIPIANTWFHGCYLETKSAKGTLTKEQKEFMNFLYNHGYECAVCRSVEELVDATELYLNITLKNK